MTLRQLAPIVVRAVPDEEYVEPDWHRAIVDQLLPGKGTE